ncbi:MAG: GtrA family protein [Oscillospiraceae bacterium]|nr:GtrA family protein [Oscillospiraceae bacterium]
MKTNRHTRSGIIDKTTVKFLIVGVANTVVGAGCMFLLYNVAHCTYWLSSAANYIVGGIVSFVLNKYFTFQKRGWDLKEVARFVVNVILCYLIAYGIAKPTVLLVLSGQSVDLQENVAMAVGMCLYTGLNYLGQRYFAFK